MTLLVDTCTFIWMAEDSRKLSTSAKAALADPEHRLLVSSVTYWEVTHKHLLGKLPLAFSPSLFFERVTQLLDVEIIEFTHEDALAREFVHALHKDPFDLMLICQAQNRGLTLVTPDPAIRQYPIPVLW